MFEMASIQYLYPLSVWVLRPFGYHGRFPPFYCCMPLAACPPSYRQTHTTTLFRSLPPLQAEYNTPLAPPVARSYFRDVLQGLEYLHFQRVVHRDLKPSNILVSDKGVAKIGDFGVSLVLRTDSDILIEVAGA